MIKRTIASLICISLILQQAGFAQMAPQAGMPLYLRGIILPANAFQPIQIRLIMKNPGKGKLDIYLDMGGQADITGEDVKSSAAALMEYFKIGLRLPNSAFWVNLRPDSPDRVIDPVLERTDMGRVFLEADVQLKKDLCLLTDPGTSLGREYWNKLYARATELYKGEDVQIPTVTRPWIVPGEIVLGESVQGVYIYKALLKVMLQQDYVKNTKQSLAEEAPAQDQRQQELNAYSTELLKKSILPRLNREVNTSGKYAAFRQVYFSLILAQWYKSAMPVRLADSLIDSKDIRGLESKTAWSKRTYFEAYRRSFSQGEYSKQESVIDQYGITVRQYVSGGATFSQSPDIIGLPGLPVNRSLVLLDGGLDDDLEQPDTKDFDSLFDKMEAAYRNRNIKDVYDAADRMLGMDIRDADKLGSITKMLINTHDPRAWEYALGINDKLGLLDKNFVMFNSQRAIILDKLKRHDEAQKLLKLAIGSLTDSSDLRHLYAAFMEMEEHDKALTFFDEWIVKHPEDALAYQHKISVLMKAEEWDESLSVMHEAMKAAADLALMGFIAKNIGKVLRKLGRPDKINSEIIAVLERKCELWPQNPSFMLDLARRLNSSGRPEAAEKWLSKMLALPDVDPLFQAEAYCRRIEAAVVHRDMPKVNESMERFLDLEIDNVRVLKRAFNVLMAINKEHVDKDILIYAKRVIDQMLKLDSADEDVQTMSFSVERNLAALSGALSGPDAAEVAIRRSLIKIDDALETEDSDDISRAVDELLVIEDIDKRALLDAFFMVSGMKDRIGSEFALRINTRMLDLDKDDSRTYSQRYKLLRKMGRDAEAREALELSLRLNPDPVNLHQKYIGLLEDGKLEEALSVINNLLEMDKGDIRTYSQKAHLFIMMGKFEQALQVIRETEGALPLKAPDDIYIQVQKSIALRLLGRYQEALEILRKFDGLDNSKAESILVQRILIKISAGDADGARAEADKLLRLDPAPAVFINSNIIRAFLIRKRCGDALDLIKALERDKSNNILMGYKFDSLLGLHEVDEAMKVLIQMGKSGCPSEYISLYQDKLLLYTLLKSYMLFGIEDAEEEVKSFLKKDPQNYIEALQFLVRHIKAQVDKPLPSVAFSPGQIYLEDAWPHIAARHIYNENSHKSSYTGFFPVKADKTETYKIARELADEGIEHAFPMRNLPDNDLLEWWPEDVYISYFRNGDSDELVRMVFVIGSSGKVITAYPTSGPGVFHAIGSEFVPSGVASLSPYRTMVWNKQSLRPVYVLSEGMLSLVNDPRLEQLEDPAQREQLGWLAVARGTLLPEKDGLYDYYSYEIPYKDWVRRLEGDTVVVKVDKKTRTLAGLESLRDGGVGGIDLRSLPAGKRPQQITNKLPVYTVDKLPAVWDEICKSMNNGNLAFAQLADFIEACSIYGSMEYFRGINTYLAMVLKREEECAIDMRPDMTDFLNSYQSAIALPRS